ncbi:MAG: beta-ketoacyl-ACP synthase [Deltaproteobacteria bacterium HGW-Deltaproteobacteria-1]|nr:MAG: beta-ketoacyl-ACP synthase [Deltaproteobacteria bacterium HGW-Deltaproteobacteria-1]
MNKRVVITGMGVAAPNAHGLDNFEKALREGLSGIRFQPLLADLKFGCQIAGVPENFEAIRKSYFDREKLMSINDNIGYASVSAVDAWTDAGFSMPDADDDTVDWDTGVIAGSGIGGMDTIALSVVPMINEGRVRRLGSRVVEQVMNSGTSARIGGLIGAGNKVTSNSSACSTGNEAVGGAMLLLEDLETALARRARIYAEVVGGAVNSGGQRMGGSMTAPNPEGVKRCIRAAVADAAIDVAQVDAINGHLTATYADPIEVRNWADVLERTPDSFPYINSTKSLIGHCLGAAGAIECVASVLQVYRGFLHPSINCEDVHPDIMPYAAKIPQSCMEFPELKYLAKAGFGFGDVNSCIIFKKWEEK